MSANQGYTNTFILEANRLSSEEVKAGNRTQNALFTNKVNDGLKLDTGDVVSVHSAYISELGAEGSDIEIKGVDIDTLNASQLLSYNEIINNTDPPNASLRLNTQLVNGFPLSQRVERQERIQYRDDKINMVMNPYKNANGEFYITLPYNYAQPLGLSEANQILAWNTPNPIVDNSLLSASNIIGDAGIGNITKARPSYTWNASDIKSYAPISTPNASTNTCNRHDNSRYALYQLTDCIHLTNGCLATADRNASYDEIKEACLSAIGITSASYICGERADGKSGNHDWRDIATFPYTRVKNRVDSSVSSGYNSNSDIASKITEDMLRTENIERKVFNSDPITTTADNQVNKTYACSNIGNFNPKTYAAFNEHVGYNAVNDEHLVYAHIEAFNTIGVKRPDLYDLGRELMGANPSGYKFGETFYPVKDAPQNASGLLHTTIPWSKVQDLKNLVDAQHRYPELFDFRNLDSDTVKNDYYGLEFLEPNSSGSAGFLHTNQVVANTYLGYDLNDNQSDYWVNTVGLKTKTAPNNDMCSIPIFFDINASTREVAEGIVATGQDWEHAVYGFAVKIKDSSGDYFIGLKSSNHQAPQDIDGSGNLVYLAGTKIGWDRHFTAYGCPCNLLWNGFCGEFGMAYEGMGISSFIDEDTFGATPTAFEHYPHLINRIYCGSPNVVMGFDPETDRFEFRNLHTSEKIGNEYNAGYSGDDKYEVTNASGVVVFTNPDLAVPVNSQADTDVYKLNKQLLRTNYTPSMTPYNTDINASFFTSYRELPEKNASFVAQQTFNYFNNNFDKQAIYDSQMGNYIIDWGMNEKYWDDSLWGIMGFRYSQTVGQGNTQTRVIDSVKWGDKIQGMDENTTNANVNNSDFDNLQRNMFNTPTFSLHPPVAQTPRFLTATTNACHTFLPAVSITQTKGQPLRALEIPTRTLRPYYTIRSNIVGQAHFFGSGDSAIPLPVVAVVQKVSQSGDFFNLEDGKLQFTITQPTMLTDITTSIHDPDGSYSKVSPNSAVLYEVKKQQRADMNVVSTILQGANKKQQIQFQDEIEPPEPTKKDISSIVDELIVPNNP